MAITVPALLTTPFAANGAKNEIPVNAVTVPGQTNLASWMLGFPPITMIPVEAGGKPPEGMDINGVLHAISAHTVFQNSGGQYKFNADFAETIGGYPEGVILVSDDFKSAYISLVDNNTENFNTADPIQNWKLFAGEGAGLPAGGQPGQILTKTETGAGWANQGNYSNVFSLPTSTQLDESHFGSLIFAGLDTAGVVMTLPKSDTAAKGKKITISSNRAGVTINPYEGDHIRFGNFTGTENGFFLPPFSTVTLVSNGNGNWTAVSEVPSGNLAETGYRTHPDGFIEQWGVVNITVPSGQSVSYPTPFPNGTLSVQALAGSGNNTASIGSMSKTGFVVQTFRGADGAFFPVTNLMWRAIGY